MQLGLLYQLLCKHKTVATLEPIRGVSLLTCINEGGTTLRRPFLGRRLYFGGGEEMLYLIGGSPCSGKSTMAAHLAERYQLIPIKLDDLVEGFTQAARRDGAPPHFNS